MSYDNNDYGGGHKPDPTIEKSLKYIAQHVSFKQKKDLQEVFQPLTEGVNRIADNVEKLAKQSGGTHDNK